jgi:hypothetical protein
VAISNKSPQAQRGGVENCSLGVAAVLIPTYGYETIISRTVISFNALHLVVIVTVKVKQQEKPVNSRRLFTDRWKIKQNQFHVHMFNNFTFTKNQLLSIKFTTNLQTVERADTKTLQ